MQMIDKFKQVFARWAAAGVLIVVAAILSLGALAWWSVALYLALDHAFEPPIVALLTGLAVLAVAGLLALVAWLAVRAERRRSQSRHRSATAAAPEGQKNGADLGATLGRASAEFIGTHGKTAAFSAFVAGFTVGANPRLRRNLGQQLSDTFR